MKKILTKKNVLIFSSLGILLLIVSMYPTKVGVCADYSYDCKKNFDFLQDIVSIFPILFLFSFTTYKMKDEVFHHWMKFAVWATPAIMILTFLILGGGSNNGFGMAGAIGGAFDALLFIILYSIFCGVSIWRIVSKHRHTK